MPKGVNNTYRIEQAKRRDREYNYEEAFRLFRECIEGLKKDAPAVEMYMASLTFLAKCSEAGLFYR